MPASKYKLERKCEMCGETFLAKTLYPDSAQNAVKQQHIEPKREK